MFAFIAQHWPACPPLPVQVPMLLLLLQSMFEATGLSSPLDTMVRAANYVHRMFGHPELVDDTLTAARAGWRRIASSRVKHTAMISTEQIASLIAYTIAQQSFVHFRLAVVVALMATSGLRKTNVLRLAPYDLFFFEDRLVLFISSAKNRMHRHGSFRTVARMPSATWCAVHLLEQYLARCGLDTAAADEERAAPIFRASRGSKSGTVLIPATWATKPISDSTMSSLFRTVANHLGFHDATFHSLRVWMASSLMASDGVILTKRHGDWKSQSVHTYVEQTETELLVPSKRLSAKIAAKYTGDLPPTAVSIPTTLPTSAPVVPRPSASRVVGPDEVLISW